MPEEKGPKPLFRRMLKRRSQNLPEALIPNGAIFISNVRTLKKKKSFYNCKIVPYIMPRERSVDIDDIYDFKFAEVLMKK